jgi:hypothetical protein
MVFTSGQVSSAKASFGPTMLAAPGNRRTATAAPPGGQPASAATRTDVVHVFSFWHNYHNTPNHSPGGTGTLGTRIKNFFDKSDECWLNSGRSVGTIRYCD